MTSLSGTENRSDGASPGRILVVDDDATLCETLRDVLSADGHRVGVAPDGSVGLRHLMQGRFDVVITDLNMPEMQGVELLGRIKKERIDVTPIVLTGYGTIEAAVESMRLGAFDYLLKPFRNQELRAVVWRCLARLREERARPAVRNLKQITDEAVDGFLIALEAKDRYTRGHSERVAAYARMMGEGLGLAAEEVRRIEQSGRLHDLGKIGVRLEHLNKAGPLTQDEHELYKLHVPYGKRILDAVSPLRDMTDAIYHHHERFDGTGYLTGASRLDIPLGGRILVICDSFDAMTSDRPYRHRLPLGVAVSELERCAGSQFEPDLVRVFIAKLRERHDPADLRPEDVVVARESTYGGLGPLIFTRADVEEGRYPEWDVDPSAGRS